jgi:5-methylcytosine-specific restriction endonuclease McrA
VGRPERLKYIKARNRASNYTKKPEVRRIVFEKCGYKCVVCDSTERLTIDHIISVYRGGNNDLNNLQCLCNKCNAGKAP